MIRFPMPKWLRRIVRRNTHLIPEQRALLMRRKLSYAYAFVAWNVFGIIGYMIYSGRIQKVDDNGVSQARQFAKMLKKENVTLYRIEGLRSVGSVNLDEEFKEAEEEKLAAELTESENPLDEFTFEEDISSK